MEDTSQGPAVVITGAAGYVGRHVVRAVADRGLTPVAVVRPGRSVDLDPRARVVETDILRPGASKGIVDSDTAAFIHLAWQDGFVHNSAAHMHNLSAHSDLLNDVAEAGVPRLAALGTMHEVGYWEGPISAETPTNPSSQYGIAKDALRRSASLALADKTEFVWLRCYYIYGDDRRSNSIFARLLEAVDRGQPTMPFTSGANLYDFIRVEDLGDQIAEAALTPGLTGVVNCASGAPESLAERVESYIRDNDLPITLEYGAFPDRPYDSPGVWADTARIEEIMRAAATRRGGAVAGI